MTDEWRLTVKLKSRAALLTFMKHHKLATGYALAKKAQTEGHNLKPGTATFLVKGHRNTCSPDTAHAIEETLQCPPGFLFERQMSQVCADSRRGARMKAAV